MATYAATGDVHEAALRATVSSSFVIEGFDSRSTLRVNRREAEVRADADAMFKEVQKLVDRDKLGPVL